ncbi:WD40-repeat-containing domain protein [Syncephalis plumigaleata]|nr:WD40-repeat-containing domain protein [Syncephalis plumigaleata]
MHISKPAWIGHLDERQRKVNIFSVDVHPDGTRLVTGGLDTKVKIWNTKVILKHSSTSEPEGALLCTLALHDGAVLCVKWSNRTGEYLATGSDDKIIVIWMLDTSPDSMASGVFGSLDGAQNLENWKAIKRLVGHESDVADLAWSPDNKYLASCGLDSKVIIWHGNTFEMLRKLDQHHGFVKGVAWDPIGKYLATQSDDKSTIIWRIADWQIEKTITSPYTKSTSTTFFSRPSWSPDGVQLVTANAFNKGVASAAVIQRDTWKSDVHFIGHDAAIEVVRFNPCLFRLSTIDDGDNDDDDDDNDSSSSESSESESSIGAICALGSQDQTISFWLTSRPRSLMVTHDIFKQGVLDMAWSMDGRVLYACSLDGTVTVIQLGEQEIGKTLTTEEQEMHFSSLGLKMRSVELAETPEQLDMEQSNTTTTTTATTTSKASQPNNRVAMLMGHSDTDDIEPMQITATSTPLQNNTADVSATFSSGIADTSSISIASSSVAPAQKVTITADGRRRIQPQFIRGLTTTSTSHTTNVQSLPSVPSTPVQANMGLRNMALDHLSSNHMMEMTPPSRAMPPGGIESVVVGQKRPAHEMQDSASQGPNKMMASYSAETRTTYLAPELAISSIRLGIPKIHSTFSRSRINDKSWVFECHNSISQQNGAAQIICSRQGKIFWKQLVSSPILLLVASSMFSAAACEDGTIHVFSTNGRRLFPSLCLNAPPSFLDCNGRYLLCLTAVGQLFVWDIVEREAILANESIAALLYNESTMSTSTTETLSNATTITDACVHANGTPVLCTSNGCAYAYDQGMRTWSRIVDTWYAASEYFTPVTAALNPNDINASGPLMVAQVTAERTCTDRHRIQRSDRLRGEQRQQTLLSIDHLESQLASAQLMASPEEYRRWLLNYARRLSTDSLVNKAEELCRELLGPSYANTTDFTIASSDAQSTSTPTPQLKSSSHWEPIVCGLRKHDLLQAILPILANNRSLQRVVQEFSGVLKQIEH